MVLVIHAALLLGACTLDDKNPHGDDAWSITPEYCELAASVLTLNDTAVSIDGCSVQYVPSVGDIPEMLSAAYYNAGNVVTSVSFRSDRLDATTQTYPLARDSADYSDHASLGGLGSGASGTIEVSGTILTSPNQVVLNYQVNATYPSESPLQWNGIALAGAKLSGGISITAYDPTGLGDVEPVDSTKGTEIGPNSSSCKNAAGTCSGWTKQCNGYTQSPCYCASACVCHYCGEAACEAQNRSTAGSLGLSCGSFN